jgi:pilus assembly protein FimV
LAVPFALHAAGLGRLTVLSPLGQPLNAEIEIVSLQTGEEEGLAARLASPDAFQQAGIEYNPMLTGLRFAIERRGGRPLVRLTTAQAVNEPFVDLLVELQWATGRLVREYTFLLDPLEYKAPAPVAAAPLAPSPAQKPVAQPVPAPAAAPAVEEKPLAPLAAQAAPAAPAGPAVAYEVKKGDTLGAIARQHLAPGVSLNQMLIAIYRANEDAFIRNNVNLVRAGKILVIPSGEESSTLDPQEANRLVRSHMADFAEYRSRLAAAPTQAEAAPGQRAVTGRIEPKPEAQPPAAAPDQLRLSKSDPKKPGAAGSRAARDDDRVAQGRATKEAESRVSDLEKNVADLQKLLALKNQQVAELEKKATAKPAPEKPAAEVTKPAPAPAAPQKPAAETPKPAAEAPKPVPEPAKPAAEAPKPAPPPAPQKPAAEPAQGKPPAKKGPPEPSVIDAFLDNPIALGALGGVVLLLVGYGFWAWRRKKATQAKFQDSVLGASPGGSFGAASVVSAPAAAATPAAVKALGASQAPASPPQASLEAEEVDPIAEADVYMAYGRDAQAEEILKESLKKDQNRVTVHAKLLEIYANRRDAKAFEQTALKLKGLTNSTGPEWDKAAALGRSIDPQNGVYAGAGGAAAAPAAAVAAPAAAPTLDFDLGGGGVTQATATDITLDEPAKDAPAASMDFDLGGGTPPPAAPAAAPAEKSDFAPEGTLIMGAKDVDQTGSGGLDFDLGLGGDEAKPVAPAAPAPKAAPAPAPAAADSSGGLDFDLNLDLGTGGDKPAEPAAAAPAAMDLSGISLDLGSAGEPSAGSGGADPKWQEVATKLDLAKAYEEMGDKDGARELLNEVMKDGDAAQKGQAQQLLGKLA